MFHRKTDNTPVTDESLAGVRDEIAEQYSRPSHETDSLIAAIDAGNIRTPILGNVIAHDCITFRMQGRDIPLQMLQSARDEAESYRERMIALTAQRDALRKVLLSVEHQLATDSDLDDLVTAPEKYDALLVAARAALALADGAE